MRFDAQDNMGKFGYSVKGSAFVAKGDVILGLGHGG